MQKCVVRNKVLACEHMQTHYVLKNKQFWIYDEICYIPAQNLTHICMWRLSVHYSKTNIHLSTYIRCCPCMLHVHQHTHQIHTNVILNNLPRTRNTRTQADLHTNTRQYTHTHTAPLSFRHVFKYSSLWLLWECRKRCLTLQGIAKAYSIICSPSLLSIS